MKTIDDMLIGCEHDGSYIPVKEVRRLMEEYASQQSTLDREKLLESINEAEKHDLLNALTDYFKGCRDGVKAALTLPTKQPKKELSDEEIVTLTDISLDHSSEPLTFDEEIGYRLGFRDAIKQLN